MQSRLAGREEQLQDLLRQLVEAKLLDPVAVDEALLKNMVQEILQASGQVRMVAGDEE